MQSSKILIPQDGDSNFLAVILKSNEIVVLHPAPPAYWYRGV